VPEGVGQFLHAAGVRARREADLDARRAELFQFVEPCATRLLQQVRHAADLHRARRRRPRHRRVDHPEEVAPTIQWGVEAKLPFIDGIPGLPQEETMGDIGSATYLADLVSYQHPDHDTEEWPAEAKKK
jgi:hypothetical protein